MERFESGDIYDILVYSEDYIRDSIRILTARLVLDSLPIRDIPLGLRGCKRSRSGMRLL